MISTDKIILALEKLPTNIDNPAILEDLDNNIRRVFCFQKLKNEKGKNFYKFLGVLTNESGVYRMEMPINNVPPPELPSLGHYFHVIQTMSYDVFVERFFAELL